MPHTTASRQRHKTLRIVTSLILQALFLAACASSAAPSLTLPAPKVAIITAIPSSTVTASPTNTPWPTLAPTFTLTPTPTPVTVLAGTYPQSGRCIGYPVGGEPGVIEDGFPGGYETIQVTWCVSSVIVEDGTGNMLFLTSWQCDNTRGLQEWHKFSDAYNRNMFLVDNLGNRYDHIASNDAARDGGSCPWGKLTTHTGSFTFPPAQPGAYSFIFVDLDQQLSIVDILLTTPAAPSMP